MISGKNLLLIIGAPRSGTTWLQIMLGAHPLVATTVEQTLYSRYTAPWIAAWQREAANIEQGRWYQGLPYLWSEDEFYDFLREFVGRVYGRVLEGKPQATHVLGKHPGYSAHVHDINRLLPGVRFIHVLRDGRDVALSMVAARKRIGFGAGTIQDAARAWKEYILAAREASRYQGRYLEIKYEDLLSDGPATLRTVFDFCGLPVDSDQVVAILEEHQFERMKARRQAADGKARTGAGHYRQGQAGGWQAQLGARQRCIFHQLAGDLLCELGYAGSNWWAGSKSQKVVLPPLAALSIWSQQASRRLFRAAAELLGPRLADRVRAARRGRRQGGGK